MIKLFDISVLREISTLKKTFFGMKRLEKIDS